MSGIDRGARVSGFRSASPSAERRARAYGRRAAFEKAHGKGTAVETSRTREGRRKSTCSSSVLFQAPAAPARHANRHVCAWPEALAAGSGRRAHESRARDADRNSKISSRRDADQFLAAQSVGSSRDTSVVLVGACATPVHAAMTFICIFKIQK